MTDRWERLTDLYHAAVALPNDDERAAFLQEACAGDPALLTDVQRLVAAHDRASPSAEPPAPAPAGPEPPDHAGPLPDPTRCGPYRLLDEIGHGRLGTVHLAARDDARVDQRVAIELIDGDAGGERVLDDVRALYRQLDAADHPNVARFLAGATTDDGRPYLVMEYIEGEAIDVHADARHLSVAERLQLFVQACEGVSYAHRRRVIHGAIKPSSILVTRAGVPKLLGFGPAGDQSSAADDIFSLGVVLDVLLGSDGSTDSRRSLRRDLDIIVRTALQPDTRRSYESVDALAADVRRALEAVSAKPRRPDRGGESAARPTSHPRAVLTWTLAAAALLALGFRVASLVTGGANRAVAAVVPATDAPVGRVRLRVADFTDHAGDPRLAAALSDAFRTGLRESPAVRVVTAPGQRADAEVAGSIDTAAAGYAIMVRVTRPGSRDSASGLVETATDSSDTMRVLGRLAERVRELLGEPRASIAATPPLVEVTTASLPALRAYASATRAIADGERAGGLRLLGAAVAVDTGFAAAHHLMALTHLDAGDRARATAALDRAIANYARLPFYTRYHTVASHAMSELAEYAAAIDAYNRILERYPDDLRALEGLGRAHAARREYAVQESLLVRAMAVDPRVPSFATGLVLARVNQGKYGAALRALDSAEQRFPGEAGNALAAIALAASRRDWDTAEREATARLAASSRDATGSLDGIETVAAIRMTRGRLADAERDLHRVVASGSRRGGAGRALAAAVRLAYLELRYRRSPAAARAMQTALTRFPLARVPQGDRPYDVVARLFAAAGQPARAAELIAESARTTTGRRRVDDAERRWTLGVIAMAEGRAWEGEIELQAAAASHSCPVCVLPDLARAYEVAGKPDSAIATYDRYLRTPWQHRHETDALELGFAMERLGALYQQQRDSTKAAVLYAELVELWRGADPALAPLVADVRQRLEQTGAVAIAR